MILGCIADDFTGATDLANTLVKAGMSTIQMIGVPEDDHAVGSADAVVIALKSRTIPASEAVHQSLEALDWLRRNGAEQIVFKYCSTFDSTADGNIGPVADALMDALDTDFTIACPAFPATGRSIFKGYLFVNDGLLSESGMQDHPLTPMTDANLVRVLQAQTARPVGLVGYDSVRGGSEAVAETFDRLRADGINHAIVDAVFDDDLLEIGRACRGLKLITGGSGIAMGLPENFRTDGKLGPARSPELPRMDGIEAALAGSCSRMTRAQVSYAVERWPSFLINPDAIAGGEDVAGAALDWASDQSKETPILIYSSADPDVVAKAQEAYGRAEAGEMIETAMGRIANGLVELGVSRLVVAGGETSGAVVQALNVSALRIGPEIDPGVPWTEAIGAKPIALALKSGNFGGEDFFDKALGMLRE